MSGNDKNMSVYSASDIQKYLRGELSAPEMHQLELAALEDPMLSDALEGMAIHHSFPSPSAFQQDLGELQQRLNKRVGNKDKEEALLFFRSPMKAAAVLILLVGLGLTTYFLFFMGTAKSRLADSKERPSSPVAVTPSTADSGIPQNQGVAGNQPPAADADKSVKQDLQASKVEKELSSRQKQIPATDQNQATYSKADRSQEPPAPAATTTDKQVTSVDGKTIKLEKAAELAASRKTEGSADPEVSITTDKERYGSNNQSLTGPSNNLNRNIAGLDVISPTDQLVFTGKVIDQNNRPLSGAALYLAGNYLSNTTTDKNGYFSLRLPKNDTVLKLTVNYVGYEQTSLGLSTDNRAGNVIQLQPQANAMSEVVVTGYGAKRKEILQNNSKPKKEFLPTKAEPVIGWPAYESYLDINKKIVDPDSTLKGSETISFIVNDKGVLSSFKVEQSLSPAHDSATIHLIQQGPSWKLLKGRWTRAWVTISF